MAFWRNAPATQAAMQQASGCTLAMGLGEAPLVRQCTFSLWKDTSSMLEYAHQGAHQQAIEAAYKHRYFSESLFVRMRLLHQDGSWPAPSQIATSNLNEELADDAETTDRADTQERATADAEHAHEHMHGKGTIS